MQPTRRLWATAALVPLLTVQALVFEQPIVLAGAVAVGVWLLARQYLFVRTLSRTVDSLSITQSPAQRSIRTDESIPVSLTIALGTPSSLELCLEAGLPTATTTADPHTIEVDPGRTSAHRVIETTWPVAGTHDFTRATLTATDGYFRETLSVGSTPTVTVEPRGPRALHVGEAGDRIPIAYGTHRTRLQESGLEPVEIRQYVPGDSVKHVDWKATARRGTPHVREYEGESDRSTQLLVDHRAALGAGPPAETKLDYLREVALAIAGSARRFGDPVGLLTVGDGGITDRFEPDTTPHQYATIRRHLLEIDSTAGPSADPTREDAATKPESVSREGETQSGPNATVTVTDGSTAAVDRSVGSDDGTGNSVDAGNETSTVAGRTRSGIEAGRGDGLLESSEPSTSVTVGPAHSGRRLVEALGTGDEAFSRTVRPFFADRRSYRERIEDEPLYGAVRSTMARRNRVLWVLFTDDSHPSELRETVTAARTGGSTVLVILAPTVLYEPGGLTDLEEAYERYLAFEELRRDLTRLDRVTALEVGPEDRLSTVLAAGRDRSRGGR